MQPPIHPTNQPARAARLSMNRALPVGALHLIEAFTASCFLIAHCSFKHDYTMVTTCSGEELNEPKRLRRVRVNVK